MADRTYNVLFICTGNSARSILAEGLMNHYGRGRFIGHSAGSKPKGEVHPLAIEQLRKLNLPTDGLRSKSWHEFARTGAAMDVVFTVCDKAANEACPAWPGPPVTAQWSVADPASVTGTDEQRALAFRDATSVLTRRIQLMLSLPIHSLDTMSLQHELREIGRQ